MSANIISQNEPMIITNFIDNKSKQKQDIKMRSIYSNIGTIVMVEKDNE